MARSRTPGLTAREAQILQALWRRGPLTVSQLQQAIPDPPTPNTVRKLLSIMKARQLVVDDGRRYGKAYDAAIEAAASREVALETLVRDLYEGQGIHAVGDLLRLGLVKKTQLRKLVDARLPPRSG